MFTAKVSYQLTLKKQAIFSKFFVWAVVILIKQ